MSCSIKNVRKVNQRKPINLDKLLSLSEATSLTGQERLASEVKETSIGHSGNTTMQGFLNGKSPMVSCCGGNTNHEDFALKTTTLGDHMTTSLISKSTIPMAESNGMKLRGISIQNQNQKSNDSKNTIQKKEESFLLGDLGLVR